MRSHILMILLFTALTVPSLLAQGAPAPPDTAGIPVKPASRALLDRSYTSGELLKYQIKGRNQDWTYSILAAAQVKRDAGEAWYEEIAWSGFQSSAPLKLSPASLDFRQTLSLAPPGKYLAVPDLSKVDPWLIGPITDLLTIYSDLFLARQFHFTQAGQHGTFAHGKPNSWADGKHVLLGQDAIDFDVTLKEVDADAHTATLLVRHVPPAHPQIKLPAAWMRTPVAGSSNNWVEVEKTDDGYLVQVGQETFDVTLKVDTADGKILSAQMHNPIIAVQRTCRDAELAQCGVQVPQTITRDVELQTVP